MGPEKGLRFMAQLGSLSGAGIDWDPGFGFGCVSPLPAHLMGPPTFLLWPFYCCENRPEDRDP